MLHLKIYLQQNEVREKLEKEELRAIDKEWANAPTQDDSLPVVFSGRHWLLKKVIGEHVTAATPHREEPWLC